MKIHTHVCVGVCVCIHGDCGSVAKACPTLEIPGPVDDQAPPSMGFPRQEYTIGLPFPSVYIYIYPPPKSF